MTVDRDRLRRLLAEGLIAARSSDPEESRRLVAKARVHLTTSRELAESDPEIAADALHAANRKAMTAVLMAAGLEPTKLGGHAVVLDAVVALVGFSAPFRVYSIVRRIRHGGDYGDAEQEVVPEDVLDNLDASAALVEACGRAIDVVPVFNADRR